MTQVHMTEADVARDFHAVIEKIQQGVEVVVEEDNRPVAVIRAPERPGRPIDECIAIARARGSGATLDEDYAKDLEEIIAQRKPLDTSMFVTSR